MLNGSVPVPEVTKVVNVARRQESTGSERVNRSITPLKLLLASVLSLATKGGGTYSLHPKATTTVHDLEEVVIFFTPEPVEAGNLEVGPEMAHVVLLTLHSFWVNFRKRVALMATLHNLFGRWWVRV